MALRILLADDQLIVREGVKQLLLRQGFQVVGEASNGREAVHLARELQPDVAVMEIPLPLLNGVDAAAEISEASPRTKLVLLTTCPAETFVLKALRAGVKGYVLKSSPPQDLIRAIQEVSLGNTYFNQEVSQELLKTLQSNAELPPDPLTRRETEVLQLVAEGKRAREIASILGITVKAAESHRTRIQEKLGINHVAGLVQYALRHGLIKI